MRVSLNQIKKYVDFELPPTDQLVTMINRQLGKVEEVIDFNDRYSGAVVVKVVSCEKHPNADRLNVCMVDDGNAELTQVVCGAPNVHEGMYAVWLKPGSTVPSTADDTEPFVLGVRELRGVMSNGMLASSKELGIGDSHDGILELTESDLRERQTLVAGANFGELFGMNDTLIDIENKMFTHRPDLFGQLGVAREIAGISGHKFVSPDWYAAQSEFETGEGIELTTFNEAGSAVPRVMFRALKNVNIAPSPVWLQCALVTLGSKPINNVVDATNYLMLLTAQPTHAYDYDKIRGGAIGARMAKQGESVKLLNGRTYALTENDIVIADAEGPVGLGGIMGGSESEVSDDTKNIVLEVATFDMYDVRKSSMRHGVFTDALTRFNKGQSPLQNSYVLAELEALVKSVSGAQVAGKVNDLCEESLRQSGMYGKASFTITPDFINARLGLELTGSDVAQLMNNVELKTEYDETNGSVGVDVPFWRTDIELPEDIVEEVGRLYGFDKLPRVLPSRLMKPSPLNPKRDLKRNIRKSLSSAGANEVLTYSFVHEKQLVSSGFETVDAFKLSNAVSPELQYYRPRLLPSIIDKVNMNIRNGYDEFILFEIGKGHDKRFGTDSENLPIEREFVDMVYASKKPRPGAAFYQIRRTLDSLAADLGTEFSYKKNDLNDIELFAPARTATIHDTKTGTRVGEIGEFTPLLVRNFKLPAYSAGASIDFNALFESYDEKGRTYVPLSRYPSVTQDISLKVASGVTYETILTTAQSVADLQEGLLLTLTPVTIYQPDDDTTVKTVTIRLNVTSHERTLSDDDVKPIVLAIGQRAKQDFDGSIV